MSASPKNLFSPRLEVLEDRLTPTVAWHGGAFLPHVQAENLYLGPEWTSAGGVHSAQYLLGFTNTLVTGNYMDALTRAGYGVGRGTALAGSVLNYNLGSTITDGQVQYAVQQAIGTGHAYYTGPNMLYVVFVEPHVAVQDAQGGSSARGDFAGYHSFFLGRDAFGRQHYIPYAVIPYPGNGANPAPQTYGYSNEAAEITDVASHEIAEAVTDPFLNAWFDNRLGEIGDVTQSYHQNLNGYYVQLESNQYDQAMPVSNGPVYWSGPAGVFGSTDGGAHWTRMDVLSAAAPVAHSPKDVASLAARPADPWADVFATAVSELYRQRHPDGLLAGAPD